MYKFAQIDNVGKVIAVSDLFTLMDDYPNLIGITDELYNNPNIHFCRYINGVFEGYYSVLEYDATTQKVTAFIFDYLNDPAQDFNDPVIFEYEGEQITVDAAGGVAEINFSSIVLGDHVVKTINLDWNGEVIIHV